MANDNLRKALQDAGIAPDELAGILGVDDRTIRRWLAGGTPYARHRAKLARALDATERQLWPHLAHTAEADGAATPATITDTIAGYVDANAGDAPSTESLIAFAREQIDLFADSSRELLDEAGLTELLLTKARDGCRVRILIFMPSQSLNRLFDTPGIEIRLGDGPDHPVTYRIDDDTLAWVVLSTDQEDQPPVLLHARRDHAPGLFQRLTDHYQRAWELAEPIQTAEEIDYYFLEHDVYDPDDHYDEDELAPDDSRPPAPDPQPPTPSATPAPRRWPGRPA